ncbi:hypothetical protein ABID42_001518 [Arcicella rosea]|uniref:glycosyl hydrolase n=1 Tax=Arcicella rosea TaxID=502909 RepID=UPI00345D0C36
MERRAFLKNTSLVSTGLMLNNQQIFARELLTEKVGDKLFLQFKNPPQTARPWVFWQWMNGNITKDGITLDLEAMHKMGVGGALCFNNAVGMPRGAVDYASKEWFEATEHAAKETNRLGMSLMIHNSPGYSGTGGSWITPEMSMQQLVWTETLQHSTGKIDTLLPKPFAKLDYYEDAFLIAYPALSVEKTLMKEQLQAILLNGKAIDFQILLDKNPETKIRIEPENNEATLTLVFKNTFEARSITINRKAETPKDLFDGPRDHPPVMKLEYSFDGKQFQTIGQIRLPELREMDTPSSLSFEKIEAKYYRLSCNSATYLSEIELHASPRLAGWSGKTNFTHGDVSGVNPSVAENEVILSAQIIDISDKMDANGRLIWEAPIGNWTILRIGHTTTGEETAAHPDSGAGLEIDKFNKKALDFHFEHFLNKIITLLKPYNSFKGFTTDSWEAGKQNWTKTFSFDFKKHCNYDILPFLPVLAGGRIVDSVASSEAFLWDFRKAQTALLTENYYAHFQKKCHENQLSYHAEPYGDGNLDSLAIGQFLDVPMAEFWTRYIYGSDLTSRQAVSIGNAYGQKVIAAEAYTGMPLTAKWTEYPYALKAQADRFFSIGINRLVFHVFVHQPYRVGVPAMTMGPFGTHFDRNSTWTNQAKGWTEYLTRCQYLLQQGRTLMDVCFYKGESPESGIPDVSTFLPRGYAGDVIGKSVLMNRLSVQNNEIFLPHGMKYRVMAILPNSIISNEALLKIEVLVKAGMRLLVLGKVNPEAGRLSREFENNTLTANLLGRSKETITSFGKGIIYTQTTLTNVFKQLKLLPDFEYTALQPEATIHYIHKELAEGTYYFLGNHKRQAEQIVANFNVKNLVPEIWDAETGQKYHYPIYQNLSDGRIQMTLNFAPTQALFVFFRRADKKLTFQSVLFNNEIILEVKPFENQLATFKSVQNNFTITSWCKPDTFAHRGKSMLIFPPKTTGLYPEGHYTVGLSVGQNGVRVFERANAALLDVVFANQPISGWTHLALVYQNAKAQLYINGILAENTLAIKETDSNKMVHPGLWASPTEEQFICQFEGNYTRPELIEKALDEESVKVLFKKGLPASEITFPITFEASKKGKTKMLFWQNGKYQAKIKTQTSTLAQVASCKVLNLDGAWKINFPKGLGAPDSIELANLQSLHLHENFGVRHFSGTANYHKSFHFSLNKNAKHLRYFLNLGRVEVLAEVKLNGKYLALTWKEPFVVELTSALKQGENLLEIAVTNLWPNRMIGDEYLPEENTYSPHKFILNFPEWYKNNQTKKGQRITFSAWKHFQKTDPLLASGLLGPVRLYTVAEKEI